jgi:hypothetical protein
VDQIDDVFNMELLKLARSMPSADAIKHIKKIFIYLREYESTPYANHQGELCNEVVINLRTTMAKVFSYVPKAFDFKEFFSFIREILFYND